MHRFAPVLALFTAAAVAFVAPAAHAQQPALPRAALMDHLAAPAVPSPDSTPNDPHAVQPERPTVATHAGTVAPGWLEIEAGVERDRVARSTIGYVAPTVLKLGIADHMQLGISGSLSRPAGQSTGMGDIAVGIKWRLLDGAPILGDFALLPSVKFPTGSVAAGTGTGSTDGSLLAISSHDVGNVAIDINAGLTHRSGNGASIPTTASLWTLSTAGPLAGRFGWTAECYGYPGTRGRAGQPPIVAMLAGPTVLLRPWLALDVGGIEPVSGKQPRALYAGGVYNVGRVWKHRV
jgi:hypothetical protein